MTNTITLNFENTMLISEIKNRLISNIEHIVHMLFPNEYKETSAYEIRVGNRGSLAITFEGEWYSHEQQVGGDVFSLIQWQLKCSFPEALNWAKNNSYNVHDTMPPVLEKASTSARTKRIQHARCLWKNAYPICDTLAQTYLCSRNINTTSAVAQKKMRFIPSLTHVPSSKKFPVLLFRLDLEDDVFAGVLRIYLAQNGLCKASVKPNKMLLGDVRGAAIRLAAPKSHIVVTEGPEDALSLMCMKPNWAVWSLSGGNILNFTPPQNIESVTIAADNDNAGQYYANELSRRLLLQGMAVDIVYPTVGKDFNDMLMEKYHG